MPLLATAAADELLSTLGCDSFEEGLLPIVRHLIFGLRGRCPGPLYRAQTIAVERWGEAIGLPVAHYMTALLSALLEVRSDGFQTRDPCPLETRGTATQDEALVLTLIHQMRRDQTPKARETVLRLSAGTMDPDVIRAGLSCAARFPAGNGPALTRTATPRLQVVD